MSFNHYYQSELTALRQLGKRFAERSPALAPFLGQAGSAHRPLVAVLTKEVLVGA